MPSELLIDPTQYDGKPSLFDRAGIQKYVPHRFEFALLDGVLRLDHETKLAVGFYDAKPDAFWVRGHVPGRPLMPGVLMVEAAAQLCTFVYQKDLAPPGGKAFVGFGGIDEVRFRGVIVPPARLLLAVRCDQLRARASYWTAQGFSEGKPVFEGKIFALTV